MNYESSIQSDHYNILYQDENGLFKALHKDRIASVKKLGDEDYSIITSSMGIRAKAVYFYKSFDELMDEGVD